MWPCTRPNIASAGLPGMSRGMRKFTVMAAHSAMSKKPRRRARNLISPTQTDNRLLLWLQVQYHHAPVRHVVQAGLRVRVRRRRETGVLVRVVLEPVDLFQDGDDRQLLHHDRLDLVGDHVLGGRTR